MRFAALSTSYGWRLTEQRVLTKAKAAKEFRRGVRLVSSRLGASARASKSRRMAVSRASRSTCGAGVYRVRIAALSASYGWKNDWRKEALAKARS